MSTLHQIRHAMANLGRGHSRWLKDGDANGYWVIVTDQGEEGVAIRVPVGTEFQRQFAHAKLRTGSFGTGQALIALTSTRKDLRMEFSHLCRMFLESRVDISKNPEEWWKKVTELIGNSIQSEVVYPVFAELHVLKGLFCAAPEKPWVWRGPDKFRHDIDGPGLSVEVKSTLSPANLSVIVNGPRQLDSHAGKQLWLPFVRLETSPGGKKSIDSYISDITSSATGSAVEEIAHQVVNAGFDKGCPARYLAFEILETRVYRVDDQFPRLLPECFVGGETPAGIGKISYEVLLDGLESLRLDEWLERDDVSG